LVGPSDVDGDPRVGGRERHLARAGDRLAGPDHGAGPRELPSLIDEARPQIRDRPGLRFEQSEEFILCEDERIGLHIEAVRDLRGHKMIRAASCDRRRGTRADPKR
jgi:hypothetical protein